MLQTQQRRYTAAYGVLVLVNGQETHHVRFGFRFDGKEHRTGRDTRDEFHRSEVEDGWCFVLPLQSDVRKTWGKKKDNTLVRTKSALAIIE